MENTSTIQQLVPVYYSRFQVLLPPSTIYRHLVKRCHITIKRAHPYPELCTDDDTKKICASSSRIIFRLKLPNTNKIVFLLKRHLLALRRNYRWSRKGEVTHIKVLKLRTRSKTVIAAIYHTGIVDNGGACTKGFVALLERVMDRLDSQGLSHEHWNLIYDNAPIHTATHIGNRIVERGYNFVRLPWYSLFLNSIEEFFSKVKLLFRQVDIQDKRLTSNIVNNTEETEDVIMEENEEESWKETTEDQGTKEVEERLANAMAAV